MDFKEYEDKILPLFNKEVDGKVKGIPCSFYYALAACEEAGELAGKIKKLFRDHNGILTDELKLAILKEVGDNLAYLAALCRALEANLNIAATINIEKLTDRYDRGVLGGSGDDR